MRIAEYIKEYTSGERVYFREVFAEVHELAVEIGRFNRAGIKEEFGDVFHFLQLWLYWRFGINGNVWPVTRHSVQKFVERKCVWNQLYAYVGLPKDVSNFCGNCNKVEKVVKQLNKFGIAQEKAEEAFHVVVLGK